MEHKILIIIPAYNESANLGAVIRHIQKSDGSDILVIDDGSSDNTAEVACRSGVQAISLPFNMGVGVALQTGFKYALKNNYDYVVQMDADGQHDPASLPVLVNKIKSGEYDMVIGSRFLEKTGYQNPFFRRLGMAFFRRVAFVILGDNPTDPTSGFRAMNKKLVEFFCADIFPFDYPDTDVIITMHRAGFKYTEVPVLMHPRAAGKSQHSGLKPIYYFFRMMLAILAIIFRKSEKPHE